MNKTNNNLHTNKKRPFRVLICGGGVSGLVFAHFLLNQDCDGIKLPIEVTFVEKATRYAKVGALITVDGQQTLDILSDIGVSSTTLHVPLEKQYYVDKKGKLIRDFDASLIHKYKDISKLFERATVHSILYEKIGPQIPDFRFKTIVQSISEVSRGQGVKVLLVDRNVSNQSTVGRCGVSPSLYIDQKLLLGQIEDEEEEEQDPNRHDNCCELPDQQSTHLPTSLPNIHNESSPTILLNSNGSNGSNSVGGNSVGTPMKVSTSFSSLSTLSCSSPSSNTKIMQQPNLQIEEFDLVVGADGINSQTRNLVFGSDVQFKKYLNVGYMCFMVDLVSSENDSATWTGEKSLVEHCKILSKKVKEGIESSHTVSFLLDRGRYMTISRNVNRCYVSCAFTLDEMIPENCQESESENVKNSENQKGNRASTSGSSSGSSADDTQEKNVTSSSSGSGRKLYTRQAKFDIDVAKRKQFLVEKFNDVHFLFPQLIQLLDNSSSIYYDDLAQIHIDKWHKGRVVLLGDSCQALTPLSGKGASMALIGAKTLADELKRVLVQHAKMDGADYIRDIPLEKLINHQEMPCLKDALEFYERKMIDRIKEIQRKTIREGDFFLSTSTFKQFIRNSTLKYMPKKLFLKLSKKDAQSNDDFQPNP